MTLSLEVGLMRNIETHNYGDPYKVIENISLSKERNLDVLIGPEWSMTHEPNVLLYDDFKDMGPDEVLDKLFDFHEDLIYAPKDAKKLLEELLDSGRLKFNSKLYPLDVFAHKKFRNLPQDYLKSHKFIVNGVEMLKVINTVKIPYSKREYLKLIKSIKKETEGSDLLVVPGTAMYYDRDLKLYNAAPVIYNGRTLRTFYKLRDGGGSSFNLNGTLKLSPDPYSGTMFEAYGNNPVVYFKGKKIGIEICADSGILKAYYGIDFLDLQILVSCGVDGYLKATSKDGYLAIVDGLGKTTARVKSREGVLKPTRRYPEMDVFTLKYD
ncbi:MAG: hypothetical protein QW292_02820 [Candidatus Parvarchaeota archaeon]